MATRKHGISDWRALLGALVSSPLTRFRRFRQLLLRLVDHLLVNNILKPTSASNGNNTDPLICHSSSNNSNIQSIIAKVAGRP
jgi:hypothetical protein